MLVEQGQGYQLQLLLLHLARLDAWLAAPFVWVALLLLVAQWSAQPSSAGATCLHGTRLCNLL